MDKIHCIHCGTLNDVTGHLCSSCGKKLYWPFIDPRLIIYCPHCKAVNSRDAQVCYWCNKPLRSSSLDATLPQPTTTTQAKATDSVYACYLCGQMPIVGQCPKCGGYYCSADRDVLPDGRPCCYRCRRRWSPVIARAMYFAAGWLICLAVLFALGKL